MLTRTLKQPSPPSTQSGFTIVECLLAIIIVTLLMTAIAPVIALSVATRLQARRVEVATQAARSYVDGVRGGTIEPPPAIPGRFDEVNRNQQFVPKRENFAQNPAPTSRVLNCQENKYCQPPSLGLYCFDVDGGGCTSNSSRDMVVQAFRSSTNPRRDRGNKGYLLGVRVYRADAFDGRGKLLRISDVKPVGGVTTNPLTRTYAGGSGNRQAPLVELTTEIGGEKTNYDSLCDRLGGCNSDPSSPSPSPSPT
jgi:prepilin-type N-terminal cleavage/methylation domain-containing protein